MKWPWKVRTEQAHLEVLQAERERDLETGALLSRAKRVLDEAVSHREQNHFRQAIEELMQQRREM